MPSWKQSASLIAKYIGQAWAGPAILTKVVACATLSVAESMLQLLGSRLAQDIGDLKDAMIAERAAEADIVIAKAVNAANRNSRQKRCDAIHAAETRLKLLELSRQIKASKEKDEVLRQIHELDKIRRANIADAIQRLKESVSSISQKGGAVFFSKSDLEELVRFLNVKRGDSDEGEDKGSGVDD